MIQRGRSPHLAVNLALELCPRGYTPRLQLNRSAAFAVGKRRVGVCPSARRADKSTPCPAITPCFCTVPARAGAAHRRFGVWSYRKTPPIVRWLCAGPFLAKPVNSLQ